MKNILTDCKHVIPMFILTIFVIISTLALNDYFCDLEIKGEPDKTVDVTIISYEDAGSMSTSSFAVDSDGNLYFLILPSSPRYETGDKATIKFYKNTNNEKCYIEDNVVARWAMVGKDAITKYIITE